MKRPVIIAVMCLIASLVVMFFGFGDTKVSTPIQTHTLALLTQEDTGSFLLQLRYGAEAAAAEAGDKLSIATLNRDAPASQIEELKADGVAAILLYAGDGALVQTAANACADAGLPLVLLDRTAASIPYAATDDGLAGALATQRVQSLQLRRVIYLAGEGTVVESRLSGAQRQFGGSRITEARWDGWANAQALPSDVEPLADKGAAVVALTGEATLAAVYMRTSGLLGPNCPVIGIDASPDSVALLEQGRVSALVLPAPYTMGYRGCGLAISMLTGAGAESVLVEPRLITLDNLYSAENVSVAFPLLQ